jgi:hypothetical protein
MLKLYYQSVNRGLSFTKPGLYAVGYVMAIGLLAIVTGINGFYLFMSTGLALLIVSGLISERVMRYNKVTHLEAVDADADAAFNLNFSVHNSSTSFTTYGIQTSFTLKKPQTNFITRPVTAPIQGSALKISPGHTAMFHARCEGLPRGRHSHIFVSQRTNYPFGFLEKYKIIELPCSITIVPATDPKLLAELVSMLNRRRSQADADREFFSHIAYTHKEPIKYIDWKRSAGKPPKDWVIKQYRSEVQNFWFRIAGLWEHALRCPDAAAYERYLSRLRTAVRALSTEHTLIGLDTGTGPVIWHADNILLALAGAPRFDSRKEGLNARPEPAPATGRCVTLTMTPDSHTWERENSGEAAV